MDADHSITVIFKLRQYEITASAGTGGSISPPGSVPINCGDSQNFTITPASCYEIADVVVDEVSQGAISSYTFSNVSTNRSITASFKLRQYVITATAGPGLDATPEINSNVYTSPTRPVPNNGSVTITWTGYYWP